MAMIWEKVKFLDFGGGLHIQPPHPCLRPVLGNCTPRFSTHYVMPFFLFLSSLHLISPIGKYLDILF
jgi:hypothetical protein